MNIAIPAITLSEGRKLHRHHRHIGEAVHDQQHAGDGCHYVMHGPLILVRSSMHSQRRALPDFPCALKSEFRVGIKLVGLTIVPRVEIVLSRGNVIRADIGDMPKMQCEGP
jgi:hypothetical protein